MIQTYSSVVSMVCHLIGTVYPNLYLSVRISLVVMKSINN